MTRQKTLSCPSLHHSVYMAPDELRHCCKRFFVKGKMKGDVRIFRVKNDSDINAEKILSAKRKLYNDINNGKKTPCSGCPYLFKDHWPELNKLELNHISVEAHSVCNMKCSYCSEIYYGGLKPNYDLRKIISEFRKFGVISKNLQVAWGGGEPVLLEKFDQIFEELNEAVKPRMNMIYSNSTKYSKTIEKYLSTGKATMTTSIDAGTIETFKKVRGIKGIKKVFENLERYFSQAQKGIIIKYILTEENSNKKDLEKFIELVEKHKLLKCSFQISSSYKKEEINDELLNAAVSLYLNLVKKNAEYVFFDYHLNPKLKNKIRNIVNNHQKNLDPTIEKVNQFNNQDNLNVIVWGAGETARQIIQDSPFFENSKVEIAFFVDSDKSKIGTHINNIEVKSPKEIKDFDYPIMIASSVYYKKIFEYIVDLGIRKSRIMNSLFF